MNALVRIDDDFSECPDGAMAYIADMLGTGFRDKMIATMGGTAIAVPGNRKYLTDDHPLVRHLGRIDAEELVEVMANEKFYIPVGNCRKEENCVAVRRQVLAGRTNNEIARDLGISERQVRRIRAKSGLGGHDLAIRLKTSCNNLSDTLRAMSAHRTIPAQ